MNPSGRTLAGRARALLAILLALAGVTVIPLAAHHDFAGTKSHRPHVRMPVLGAAAGGTVGTWSTSSGVPSFTGLLTSISCGGPSDCVAVGNDTASSTGEAIETTNGGATWSSNSLPTGTPPLTAVSCPAAGECTAVGGAEGGAGTIVAQSGGTSFSSQSVPSGIGPLTAVSCPSTTACDAIGGDIATGGYQDEMLTESSGSWSLAATASISGDSSIDLDALQCFSALACQAVGDSSGNPEISTTDAWSPASTSGSFVGSTTVYIYALSCTSSSYCLAVGNTGYLSDSGGTWTQTLNPGTLENLDDLCSSRSTCVAVGQNTSGVGVITTTFDGGAQWWNETVPSGTYYLDGITCSSSGICFSVGESSAVTGMVLKDTGDPFSPPVGGLLQPTENLGINGGESCGPCALSELKKMPAAADGRYVHGYGGDPVDTATGNLDESYTDGTVATYGPALDFTRYYNSELAEMEATSGSGLSPGPLGYGWTEPWSAFLAFPVGGSVTVNEGSGAENYFQAPSGGACPTSGQVDPLGLGTSGSYCAPPRVTATLQLSGSTYTYTLSSGTKETFNSSGQLTGITDSNGATQTITYNSPTPSSTSSTCNTSYATTVSCETITGPGSSGDRSLVLAFNAASDGGHIVRVTDPALRQWIYTYDSAGDLSTVSDPRGYETRYGYGNDSGSSNTAMNHDLVTIIRAKELRRRLRPRGERPQQLLQRRERRTGLRDGLLLQLQRIEQPLRSGRDPGRPDGTRDDLLVQPEQLRLQLTNGRPDDDHRPERQRHCRHLPLRRAR